MPRFQRSIRNTWPNPGAARLAKASELPPWLLHVAPLVLDPRRAVFETDFGDVSDFLF